MYTSIFSNNGLLIASCYEPLFITFVLCVLGKYIIAIYIKLHVPYILILYKVTKSYSVCLHTCIG